MKSQTPKRDLKEACLVEAYRIIEEQGTNALSLRDVARRLGVSHQAPYRHFASRDHILAEIVARTFAEFSAFLAFPPRKSEGSELKIMGERYLQYAAEFPLKYQLMFNSNLPDSSAHPTMLATAQGAFALLRDALSRHQQKAPGALTIHPNDDAMFIWSVLHGLASILQSDALKALQMSDEQKTSAISRTFERIGLALGDV